MTNYATQNQNQDMVSLLASQFRLLYNPSHAFADAINMALMFPALRGFWPASLVGPSGQMNDMSGNGLNLTNNSNSLFGNDGLAPFTEYDGTADYHSHVDAADFDILGTEAYINSPGLTLGVWVNADDATPAGAEVPVAKDNTGANSSYRLQLNTDGTINFTISTDGATPTTVTSTNSLTDATWYFVAGRFTPSSEVKVWVNSNTDINTTSIPASIFNGNAQFQVGARQSGGAASNFFAGKTSLVFLCASVVPDIFINTFYQMTAPLFKTSI